MAQRYGWTDDVIANIDEPLFHELVEVWRAWAVVAKENMPRDKKPAPEPGPGQSLKDLARAQGFDVPDDPIPEVDNGRLPD